MESVPVLGDDGVSPNKGALTRDETLRLCQLIAERKPESGGFAVLTAATRSRGGGGPLSLQGVYGRCERLNRMLYIGRIVRRRDVELDVGFEDPALA